MIYRNSDCTDSDGGAFSSALMSAYAAYLVRGLERKSGVDEAVDAIKEKILYSFADTDFRVSKLLSESGYAVDYIRECFRRRLGKTPVEYVNRLRAGTCRKAYLGLRRHLSELHSLAGAFGLCGRRVLLTPFQTHLRNNAEKVFRSREKSLGKEQGLAHSTQYARFSPTQTVPLYRGVNLLCGRMCRAAVYSIRPIRANAPQGSPQYREENRRRWG